MFHFEIGISSRKAFGEKSFPQSENDWNFSGCQLIYKYLFMKIFLNANLVGLKFCLPGGASLLVLALSFLLIACKSDSGSDSSSSTSSSSDSSPTTGTGAAPSTGGTISSPPTLPITSIPPPPVIDPTILNQKSTVTVQWEISDQVQTQFSQIVEVELTIQGHDFSTQKVVWNFGDGSYPLAPSSASALVPMGADRLVTVTARAISMDSSTEYIFFASKIVTLSSPFVTVGLVLVPAQ